MPTRSPRASRRAYLETTWSYAPTALLVLFGSLALELTGAVVPAAGQVLIDFSIRPRREDWLFVICAAMVAATALRLALLAVRDRSIHALTQLLDLGFMARFVDRLLALPIEFFHHRTTGDLIDRASANLELRGFTTRFFTGAIDATVVAGYTALLLAYDVPTGAVVILLSGARILVLAGLQRAAREAAGLEQARRGRETSALVQAFALPGLDRRARVREHLIERYGERLHDRLQAAILRRRITEGTAQLTILLNGLMLALVLWVGGQRLLADEISMGVLAAFLAIGALVQRPLEGVLAALVQLGRMRSVLARTDDIFETPREPSGERDPSQLPATITLDAVSFRYGHQNPDVIAEVSLHVGEGETVAIMGRSGAGKSTLARLMIGLLQPTGGAVRVGGADLAALDLDALRRLVGVVSQETFLFDDTIRNNLALKDPDLSLAEIREAARIACIDHVIAALPHGYDAVLGRQAHRLSGGERQRLAIARALVRSPRILLLDEATSALDPATEAEVYANLAALRRTQVVVAHRLAAARRADRIVVVDGGRIAQEGRYADLAAAPGLFRRMVESAGGLP